MMLVRRMWAPGREIYIINQYYLLKTPGMKHFFILIAVCCYAVTVPAQEKPVYSNREVMVPDLNIGFYTADNPLIQYTGRIDFSNAKKPRFWQPGVYIQFGFRGSYCNIMLNDEELYGQHNYIEVVVDDQPPKRIQTTGKNNNIKVAFNLAEGKHIVTVCKNTEAGIGYLEFADITCAELYKLHSKPGRKIEFIGNSITCGTGMDVSEKACGAGSWYDQHNAYMSYGPLTARALNAQWHLSSVSGIGLIHSCCDMSIVMPPVFDKVNMRTDSLPWDFNKYIPDVVTVTLGQNDGIQDSVTFCNAYVAFIKTVRSKYPQAHIICLTSPMADDKLVGAMKSYLTGIVSYINNSGDKNVHQYFYSKQYHNGCGGHPDMQEHELIAKELTAYIKTVMNW